jgi:polyribonucleotide nucleotidyltransferase
MVIRKEVEIGGRILSLETGKIAKQANGSIWIQYADTVALVAVVASKEPIEEDKGFVPLQVDYREKAYAAGKIPGGFFKREGRPSEKETLSARLIDRPIRSLFNKDFRFETQIYVTVLSSDQENDADTLGIIGASAALLVSDVPFDTPIGAVRVGKINGQLILNPTFKQLQESVMEIIVAASADFIIMVEGEASEISDNELIEALEFAHKHIKEIIPIIEELARNAVKPKLPLNPIEIKSDLIEKVRKFAVPYIKEAITIKEKLARHSLADNAVTTIVQTLSNEYPDDEIVIRNIFAELERELMREKIINERARIDDRSMTDIRSITGEIGILPRTHGSALFTRGETQSLAVTTLGSKLDEQKIEGLDGSFWKRYMLHYNFPSYCVGEVSIPRGPGRREIGHGRLAEKALQYVIPSEIDFPYTIRIVSDIFESNGSSSMATVCAGSLSLMDAGVPIKKQTAGIAMGLIKTENDFIILSDILGDEDHLGDMDLKLAGSCDGFTAVQMDIKVKGISIEIMKKAIAQAREGLNHILAVMNKVIDKPHTNISPYAPKIIIFKIDPAVIGMVIGPGGKIIREIQEKTNSTISIEEDGTVFISAVDETNGNEAKRLIDQIVAVPEVGKIYDGIVKRITPFGAFVEILPGKDGLLHISEIENRRIARVEDVLKIGQEVQVKVIKIDEMGKVDLTRKQLLNKENNHKEYRR